MPAPRETGPHNRPRRRPEPMPGGWLWIIVLLLFAGIIWILLGVTSAGTVGYSDFVDLAKKEKFINVYIRGTSSVVGELKEDEAKNLPENLKKHVKNNRLEANIQERSEEHTSELQSR